MYPINLLFGFLTQILLVSAIIHVRQDVNTTSEANYGHHTTYTTVYNSTITVSVTHTTLTTEPRSSATSTSSTSSAPLSRPSLPFTVLAIRPGTPIHQLRVNADGQRFYLGGQPSTYCPKRVEELGGCPPGETTAFGLCSMAVLVPGGQEIFALPNGELGFTQAHSALLPPGSSTCPFEYVMEHRGDQYAHLFPNATNAFRAKGFRACPTNDGRWQVLLALANVTVPSVTNQTECLPFAAFAVDYENGYAAWQYN
ncbi:uncharacterized protein A1O9_03351 [Exophiala aquamarina CBS 119918]|uniref:Ubiquitin 3 binding protein But2 C-terminal domain-containing protein n=1 Tax=Exophiala aquamarina CBS 119918 TaxID=1182545 RepID=A0A072PPK4_9EURO|nr:uncharacterized protein A1O9_03351 [Exophiala aquamarina CBS 119918]KEF61781.1 hypothetical protein A1O9_03351 [Exophiala aquamarina CBS 119918]